MISLKDRLTEILINNKIITREQLDEALRIQEKKGGRLSDIIVELNFVKAKDLVFILSEGLGFPLIDLKRFKIDPEIVRTIPVEIARKYQIIPISRIGETVTLAMADPLNIFAIDHVQSLTGFRINPIIATSEEIMQAIELYYPDATRGVIDNIVKELSTSTLEVIREAGETALSDQELYSISQQAPAIKITDMILEKAIKDKASDILVEPWDKNLTVRFRIDGVLKKEEAPPRKMHASIVSRIKVMSNLDIAEHRLPQDGRFKAKIFNREIDFRVSILPSSFGEKVAIRILDKSQATLDIERLGFDAEAIAKIQKVSKLPHGMMLVCGPTGSGKTTTLYSILKLVDNPAKNLVTVEDPIEYQLEGINQVTVRPEIGLTFASALRSILRQDPNVIMIGEIRDFETVDIAIKSALTGHLILSTLHTTTASGAIVRLVNMGVEPFLINSSLAAVLSQRLLRKICPNCKMSYNLEREVAVSLNFNIDKTKNLEFFRGRGCPKCLNTGYVGRVGICEFLLITPEIRELILSRSQEHIIKQQARREGMKTLREIGLEEAAKGITTLEEVLRVTAPDE